MEKKGAKNIPQKKVTEVGILVDLLNKYSVIASLDMNNLPAAQLQTIRGKLRDKALIRMSKKNLIMRALKQVNRPGFDKLAEHLKGLTALLFTNINPFELYSLIKQNRTAAPAKPGQTAPFDIWVKAGLTPFAPGPVISQLSAIGLKAGIEAGKVAIKEDSCVLKEGGKFTNDMCSILSRLSIEPMQIGITVVSVLENGEIYNPKILDIDTDAFRANLITAHSDYLKLAIELGILTPETISLLITKAELDAKALAVGAKILNKDSAGIVLAQVEAAASALQERVA